MRKRKETRWGQDLKGEKHFFFFTEKGQKETESEWKTCNIHGISIWTSDSTFTTSFSRGLPVPYGAGP